MCITPSHTAYDGLITNSLRKWKHVSRSSPIMQSPMIVNDRKQDARDRKISIFTSCLRRLTTQKRGNNDMEINRELFAIVCDHSATIFVHVICFDESVASISNENGVQV